MNHNEIVYIKTSTQAIRYRIRSSKQVLEVQVLLVGHILQTILAVDLCTSLVELVAHGKVLESSGESGCFTLIALLLLTPSDVQDLKDDNHPEDNPDDQNTLESIHLGNC